MIRNAGRMAYRASGYKNPMKKGVLSSTRVVKQIPKLAGQVRSIMGMLNTEKKRLTQVNSQTQSVAQVNINNSGHWLIDITPNPAQGVGFDQKTGNSIKVVGSHFDFQFYGQANCSNGCKLKIQVVKVMGQPYSTISDVMGKFIVNNKFITGAGGTGIYDLNSDRDQDYFKNYRVILTKSVWIKNDDISGEVNMKRIKFGTKYGKGGLHVRNNDNNPDLSSGQIFMLITADRGNSSATASTLQKVPIVGATTGVWFDYENVHYFVDN